MHLNRAGRRTEHDSRSLVVLLHEVPPIVSFSVVSLGLVWVFGGSGHTVNKERRGSQ